jgi:hypothetical protein
LTAAPGGRRVADREPTVAFDRALAPQGYHLEIGDDAVRVTAADEAGARHARATLAQLRHPVNSAGEPSTLPACRIDDWPDFAVRGVMLDVSRDRVPTMDTLCALVDRLAGWKVNQLQLYMEHTYAYSGHEEVWRDADPYDAEDVHALDAHCRTRGVELVANQNTLGHFERWLRHDRYRPLAIAPDGFDWLFGIHRAPMILDPSNSDAFVLVTDLLQQLVAAFGGGRVHIGLDEPWELAPQRRGEWVQWLRRLLALPSLEGRQALVWGDVLAIHPDLLDDMPSGVTVCEWGYEDNHPFDERAARLKASGMPLWVCPGTSSWLSFSGRVDNMVGNIRAAASAGTAHHAEGLLVTDWGDMGHLQQTPARHPGLAAAAAFGWCATAHDDVDPAHIAALLEVHAYSDPSGETGRAVVGLGHVHRMVVPRPPNMSALALHMLLPQAPVGRGLTTGLTVADLERVLGVLDDTDAALSRARPEVPDGALVLDELRATAALLSLSCRDAQLRLEGDGTLAPISEASRRAMVDELDAVVDEHRRLWTMRHRAGGLSDSVAWFDHLRECYSTGAAQPSWFGPLG